MKDLNINNILNLTIEEADNMLLKHKMYCREVENNGKSKIITCELRSDRINVGTYNNVIYKIFGVY
jgi:hypothetical protein